MGLFERFMGTLGYVKMSDLTPAQVAEQTTSTSEFLEKDLDNQISDLQKEQVAEKPKRVLSDAHKAKISAAVKARQAAKLAEAKKAEKAAKKAAAPKTAPKAKKTSKKS